ncbi:MAG: hypothetical protein ACYTF5_08160 [Planctomycetota bacterium]|jgi:hypothetical protein
MARIIQKLMLPALIVVTAGTVWRVWLFYIVWANASTGIGKDPLLADRLLAHTWREAGSMVVEWLAVSLLIAIAWSLARIVELLEERAESGAG